MGDLQEKVVTTMPSHYDEARTKPGRREWTLTGSPRSQRETSALFFSSSKEISQLFLAERERERESTKGISQSSPHSLTHSTHRQKTDKSKHINTYSSLSFFKHFLLTAESSSTSILLRDGEGRVTFGLLSRGHSSRVCLHFRPFLTFSSALSPWEIG